MAKKVTNICCVEICKNQDQSLSYHFYPKDKILRQKWFDAITAAQGSNPLDLNSSRVCSKHFLKLDYFNTNTLNRKRLKPFAVPSIFENTKVARDVSSDTINDETLVKRTFYHLSPDERTNLLEQEGAVQIDLEEVFDPSDISEVISSQIVSETIPKESNLEEGSDQIENTKGISSQTFLKETLYPRDDYPEDPLPLMLREGTDQPNDGTPLISSSPASSGISLKSSYSPYTPGQVELVQKQLELLTLRSKEKFTVTKFVNDDKAIKYFTGFPSYEVFWAFYQLLLPECSRLNYVGQEASQMTSNKDKESFVVKPGKPRKLNPVEEFFMTLMRLRRGEEEQTLAYLYNLSQGHVSKILNTWILFLYERAMHFPVWPSKERVEELTSKKMKEKYPNLRLIVDCTEFYLEKPSASEAQRESFSSYKHCNTAKALIGMAGSGHITYCSNLYAGRTSDKKLILHCGVLDMLEKGDAVMADRGFDISKELANKELELIIPEFLKQRDQFTSKELSDSRSVAEARIHVERAIGRIKEFKILKGPIPLTLSPMLEKFFVVCCHLSNFTGHLVAKIL